MRRVLGMLSLLGAMLVPTLAAAQEDPPPLPPPSGATTTTTGTVDTVHLRNGGLYRGHVTEIVPGDHVTVLIEGKAESKRIPWPEVERVIVASTPVPPATSGTPAAATPATPAPMVGPKARVHITSPKQVILYRRPQGSSAFVQQCTSPCNQELPIGDTYRVTGNGVAQSKEFHLDAAPGGTIEIAVDPPSTGGMILGGFMAGGGASAAYVGLLLALVGASEAAKDCQSFRGGIPTATSSYYGTNCEQQKEDGAVIRNAGLITMGVGVALTAVGIIVFLNNAGTDITQKGGGGKGEGKADPPRPLDAYLRAPVYRSASSSAENAAAAPPAAFPLIFSGHF